MKTPGPVAVHPVVVEVRDVGVGLAEAARIVIVIAAKDRRPMPSLKMATSRYCNDRHPRQRPRSQLHRLYPKRKLLLQPVRRRARTRGRRAAAHRLLLPSGVFSPAPRVPVPVQVGHLLPVHLRHSPRNFEAEGVVAVEAEVSVTFILRLRHHHHHHFTPAVRRRRRPSLNLMMRCTNRALDIQELVALDTDMASHRHRHRLTDQAIIITITIMRTTNISTMVPDLGSGDRRPNSPPSFSCKGQNDTTPKLYIPPAYTSPAGSKQRYARTSCLPSGTRQVSSCQRLQIGADERSGRLWHKEL